MISNIAGKELGDDSITKNSNNNNTIVRGLSMEAFFTLAHALCAMAEYVKCLLDRKQFKFVLLGKLNNDAIEMHFCLMRSMSGANMALDIKSFCQNYRRASMKNTVSLCCDANGSFNRD